MEITSEKIPPQQFTFEQLPNAVAQLYEAVADIKKILLFSSKESCPEEDELLTVPDAAKFLSLSVPTIYGLIHKRQIPVMKRSQRCYFSKIELIEYLKGGRRKTIEEIKVEADLMLHRHDKKKLLTQNINK